MYTQHERIESEIVDFLIIARSKEGVGDGPWHKIEIDFVRPLLSHISKQLVSSIASIYFSLSLFPCNFIRARPCSRATFSHERQIIEGL